MKKTILALMLALLLVLTGCSGSKTQQAPTTQPTEAPSAIIVPPTTAAPAPTAAPTTAPTAPPATEPAPPATTAPAIVITKHPSSETVNEGARTWFIAKAENATQITWEFFAPDGTLYSLQQAMYAHPGLVLEELPEDTLGLRQIPASFNGWSARARYDGPGGTATTERATITVRKDPYSQVIETYRTVRRSGTGNIEKGISELVNPSDFLGYALYDLEGDGIQELILASDGNNMYPNVVYEVYTLENGNPVSVTKSAARSRYFMLYDGRFLMQGSNSAVSSVWCVYDFGKSPSLQEEIWTSDEPHDLADFAPYYYYSKPYSPEEPMVYDTAARMIEDWQRAIWLPALTPIT